MPFFSVIIPLYNKEKYIHQCIESVLNQKFKDFEIIIINDGSTDQSAQIVEKINDSKLQVYSQKNKGVSAARNLGVEKSSGKVIAFLDADDFWYPTHLDEIYSLHHEFPEASLFATAYEIEYRPDFIKSFRFRSSTIHNVFHPFYRYQKGSPLFFTSNFALKKEIFVKEKGFKSHIHAEDTELFFRLGYKYPLAYSSIVSMRHIDQADNSLFSAYQTDKKVKILKELEEYEKKDPFLKKNLDVNRFSWIIEYKINGQSEKAKDLKNEIVFSNLNIFQKLLIYSPAFLLKKLKKWQSILRKKNIYLSAYKKT